MIPALANVGAMRALADRVQVQIAGQLFQVVIGLAHRRARLQPLRLGGGVPGRKINLDQVSSGGHSEPSIVAGGALYR